MLIQISSDPDLRPDDRDLSATARLAPRESNRWGNEVLSPIRALSKSRDGRGTLAYKEFLHEEADERRRVHFTLCPVHGKRPPALGWVLSSESMAQMRQLLRDDTCQNRSAFERVLAALKPTAATAEK